MNFVSNLCRVWSKNLLAINLVTTSTFDRIVMTSAVTRTASKSEAEDIADGVKDYYGKRVKKTADLQTNVCTVGSNKGMTDRAKQIQKLIHDEVKEKYYGCGTVIPEAIEGRHVLDLGCGAGLDVYTLSGLVGPNGMVTGVDMTKEQLAVARSHIEYHASAFGFPKPNVTILEGRIEDLEKAGVSPSSVDVIVSNCVVNLAADKERVLRQAFAVLKDGGEMYFSDIYADKEIPDYLRRDPVLWGECLSGALPWKTLHKLAETVGFARPRLVRANMFQAGNSEIEKKLEGFRFISATYRLFKVPSLDKIERSCYQVVYSGEIEEYEETWSLDCDTTFPSGFVLTVDAETAAILRSSRFQEEFEFNKTKDGCVAGIIDPFALAETSTSGNTSCCPPASGTKSKCC